ncbi:hypothetical protein C7444_103179 [Sphaerotilus hippei]|uniref:DUF2946 family protein n=1 Tax=Sphaerotilus hippei TaxID=744406 RepID=A0A318H3F4_9BURK|nr:DUF2946 family protein [Sphaerotilus hippei]PXW98085.1 hypothetical protein C7444_103179 [Sphaerotilus hippei]
MSLRPRRHRLLAWLALLAALWGAVSPTVSCALAVAAGVDVVEVCTSFGVKRVAVSSPVPPDPDHGRVSDPIAHCGYCVGVAPGGAVLAPSLPPAPWHAARLAASGDVGGALASAAWHLRPSRAPPIHGH